MTTSVQNRSGTERTPRHPRVDSAFDRDGKPAAGLSTIRVAVYVRMSTDDQTDSPERQLEQVLPYCERKGYRIVGRYQDLAMRGWDDSRPEFQKLLRDAEAGMFDVIVVDEQSRLSRTEPVEFFAQV